ncbi:hypothetical protein [Paenisporosarcina sp. TG20]|uniref:hypothetical protein n=1 Tax=Paenisporosarcina sp. TG20 TaxID=1211706 RepID=UPI000312D2DE|nr:hypothetical protein [Paenisporosarcina sp. TG20]
MQRRFLLGLFSVIAIFLAGCGTDITTNVDEKQTTVVEDVKNEEPDGKFLTKQTMAIIPNNLKKQMKIRRVTLTIAPQLQN